MLLNMFPNLLHFLGVTELIFGANPKRVIPWIALNDKDMPLETKLRIDPGTRPKAARLAVKAGSWQLC